ncbi:hypothetical protein R4P64_07865 [Rhodococcus sp. IEGM 1366]|uniref:hypothetical protein n=1 Tax=Rhodococcus sp. IEGM 1366 TaxID=3082223 RepID=UPI00295355D9|nr:hypothetical protein [Rhodococcus sp. IEGM 1366]MDV8066417.1 hypothetical protein [Rhodococcus sp. IEGM 1366]
MTHAQNTLTPIADQLDRELRVTWIQDDPKSFADACADINILRTASLAHDELNAHRDEVIELAAAELGISLDQAEPPYATFDVVDNEHRAKLLKIARYIVAVLAIVVAIGLCVAYVAHPDWR